MKERELRSVATCALCGEKVGNNSLPLFWRITIERWGIKADAVMRQTGLEMMLGGSAVLAQAMGPDDDMAVRVMDPLTITVCESCATDRRIPVCALAGFVGGEVIERMSMTQCEALVATYEREGWPQCTPWCERCENDLADCICPDLESRVTNIAMQRCQRCGLTSYRCRCVQPALVLALPSGA